MVRHSPRADQRVDRRAHRVPSSRLPRPDLLDPDVVLPAVGEVVLIQEALADTQIQIGQSHLARIAAATVPILPPLDDEAMEVLVAPVQGCLQGGMQLGDGVVTADEEAAPASRACR